MIGGQQAIGVADLQRRRSVNPVGAHQTVVVEIDAPDRQGAIDALLDRAAGGDQQFESVVGIAIEVEPLAAAEAGAEQAQSAPVVPAAAGHAVAGDGSDLADLGLDRRQIGGAVGIASHALGHRDPFAGGEGGLAGLGHEPIGRHVLLIDVVAADRVFAHIQEAGQHLIGVAIDQRHHPDAGVEQLVGGVDLAEGNPDLVGVEGTVENRRVLVFLGDVVGRVGDKIPVEFSRRGLVRRVGRKPRHVLPQQVDRLGRAQIAHQLIGEIGDAPAAPLQIDRAEAEAGGEIHHVGLDRVDVEVVADFAATLHQLHLADAEIKGVELAVDRGLAVSEATAGAVVGAGVEIPDQIGAGAGGQLHHHAIGAAAIEHEAARSGGAELDAVGIAQIARGSVAQAVDQSGCGSLVDAIAVEVAKFGELPEIEGTEQRRLTHRPQPVAHHDVAVDAAHQPVEAKRAHIGGGVVEREQELLRRGAASSCAEQPEAVGGVDAALGAFQPLTGEQHIGAQGPEQGVVAGAAGQQIEAGVVLAGPGPGDQDRVVGVVADKLVVAASAGEQVVADAAPCLVVAIAAVKRIIAIGELLNQVERGLVAVEHVITRATQHQVGAGAAFGQVGAAAAEQPVVAGLALQPVLIHGTAQGRVAGRIAIEQAQQLPVVGAELAPVIHVELRLQPTQDWWLAWLGCAGQGPAKAAGF